MADTEAIKALLQRVASGSLSVNDAVKALRALPYEDLGFAKIDHHRAIRKGFAEVVFCQGKSPPQVAEIFTRLAEHNQQVLGTRANDDHHEALRARFSDVRYDECCGALWLDRDPHRPRRDGVVVVAAGTSDMPVAREAVIALDVMGHAAREIHDIGVAGLHRLLNHLPVLQAANVIIVIAGMEGALPSVVAGAVAAPVIAVPTSVGYGASFHGLAALLTMLNSCAPGIGVVNIDNGYGAAHLAATINDRIHAGAAEPTA